MNYQGIFNEIMAQKFEYLKRWYHRGPIVLSLRRNEELGRLHSLMCKCVYGFVQCYHDYQDIMQLNEKTLRILQMCAKDEYQPGTYRMDFLVCADGTLKACEITARFWCSGYFASYFSELMADQLCEKVGLTDRQKPFSGFFDHAMRQVKEYEKVCVLKSNDRPEALNLYKPFFEKLGKEVTVISPAEIEQNLHRLRDHFVINEFNQMDLLELDERILEEIVASHYVNDLRTAFLVHNKRFFSVLFQDSFVQRFLTAEEAEFLRQHIVRTYTYGENPEIWQDAKTNKDEYILKHSMLGKSEKVFAGCVTEMDKWQEIYASADIENMILQPFMQQRTFKTHWEGNDYTEYAVGTILSFDEHYFGPGLFRASSFVVTNQGDDRKFAPVITDESEKLAQCYVL